MKLKNIINWFNPLKRAWWWQKEWIKQNRYSVYEIVQENDGCSWDVKIYHVVHYRHKHSCKDRIRIDKDITTKKTIFEEPSDKYPEMNSIEHVKIYEGPKYD